MQPNKPQQILSLAFEEIPAVNQFDVTRKQLVAAFSRDGGQNFTGSKCKDADSTQKLANFLVKARNADDLHIVCESKHTIQDFAKAMNIQVDDINGRVVNIGDLYRATHIPLQSKQYSTGDVQALDTERSIFSVRSQGYGEISRQSQHIQSQLNPQDPNATAVSEFLADLGQKATAAQGQLVQQASYGKENAAFWAGQSYTHLKKHLNNISQSPDELFDRVVLNVDQLARMASHKPVLFADNRKLDIKQEQLQQNMDRSIAVYKQAFENYPPVWSNPLAFNDLMDGDTKTFTAPGSFKDLLASPSHVPNQSLLNPQWFDKLAQTGYQPELSSIAQSHSPEVSWLRNYDGQDIEDPKEKARLDFVKASLDLRSTADKFRMFSNDADKLKNAQYENGGLQVDLTAFGTHTNRHTSGTQSNINYHGLTPEIKECLSVGLGAAGSVFDANQLEIRCIAKTYGLKRLEDLFQQDIDPYLYTGSMMTATMHNQPISHEQAVQQTLQYQQARMAGATDPLHAEAEQVRDLGKKGLIPVAYGQTDWGISKRNGISLQQAQQIEQGVKSIFPEIENTKQQIDHFFKQGIATGSSHLQIGDNDNPIRLQYGGQNALFAQSAILDALGKAENPAVRQYFANNPLNWAPPLATDNTVIEVNYPSGERQQYNNIRVENKKTSPIKADNAIKADTLRQMYLNNNTSVALVYDTANGKTSAITPSKLAQNLGQGYGAAAMNHMNALLYQSLEEHGKQSTVVMMVHDSMTIASVDKAANEQAVTLVNQAAAQLGADFNLRLTFSSDPVQTLPDHSKLNVNVQALAVTVSQETGQEVNSSRDLLSLLNAEKTQAPAPQPAKADDDRDNTFAAVFADELGYTDNKPTHDDSLTRHEPPPQVRQPPVTMTPASNQPTSLDYGF
ncbi:hypothetical protein ACFBZI_11420 [Moraxella sp. ZJ142]|uniref:hypothetical protein n=1 Tax=Moraxella marmotae TaxID=3344520 RepID=UPI0035D50418